MTAQAASAPIRVTALALMQRPDGRVLLERGADPHSGQVFYRAMGGGVEFGETAAAAVQRECQEELGIAVDVGARLAVIENIFIYAGKPGHEIIFVYAVTPADSAFLACDKPARLDNVTAEVCWRSLAEIRAEGLPLYPLAFADLLPV